MAPALDPRTEFLELPGGLELECGVLLRPVRVAFRTWGRPAPGGGNAVLVCHPLTMSADVDRWWSALLGPGRALDPERDFVVCANALGSCYGTTGPASPGPDGRPWGTMFPPVTVRDQVRLQAILLERLGVRRLRLVIGGSLGGMQALEWAVGRPDGVERAVVISAPAAQPAWAIALSHAQRRAVELDPRWCGGRYPAGELPSDGLAVARTIAMCSYRSWESLGQRFGRSRGAGGFEVSSWLDHHGLRLAERFDAASYLALLEAMDSHDVGRGRGGAEAALAAARIPVLVVAVDSDVLYPAEEAWALVEALPQGELAWLSSPHGHDGFLIEAERLERLVAGFRAGRTALEAAL